MHIFNFGNMKKMKILVMGLPGSGKTYLTERLAPLLDAAWYNADKVKWQMIDFSDDGIRQSNRIGTFADLKKIMKICHL